MKLSRELRIFLFVAAAVGLLIFGIGVLQGRSIFARSFEAHAYYPDIDNLTAGSKVLVNGFQVGQVVSLEYDARQRQVKVVFDIVKDIEVPEDSQVWIADMDFFGSKCIKLQMGRSARMLENGGRLSGGVESGMLAKLGGKMDPLSSRIDSVLADLQVISRAIRLTVQDSANRANRIVRHVEATTAQLGQLTQQFGQTARRVDALTADLQGLVSGVRQSGNVERILGNTARLSDSLAASTARANRVLESARSSTEELKTILVKVNRGDGTLGQALNNRQLYDNLDRTTRSLDSLLVDLKKRPWRYVNFSAFGRKHRD